MTSHGACGKSWTGKRSEHCPACHETFTGQRPGDMHRVGDFNDGRRCLTPAEMIAKGMTQDDRGQWTTGRTWDGPNPCTERPGTPV